jgi:hypothetical protein
MRIKALIWCLWWPRWLWFFVPRQNVRRRNVRRDKTSMGTKRPWGQNVRTDKTSVGQNVRTDKTFGQTKRPTDKTFGQTKRLSDKTSVGTKRPPNKMSVGTKLCGKTSVWVIFTWALLGNIFTQKSIEHEGKSAYTCTHTLFSFVFWGSLYL